MLLKSGAFLVRQQLKPAPGIMAKRAAERYAYAKQFNQHHHQLRFLRIRNRKRLSSSFVIAITSSGAEARGLVSRESRLDTDDTKPMGKRHRHDTEGM